MGHAGTHGPVAHPRCRAQPRPGRDLRRCQGDAPPGIPRGLRLRPIAFAACRETYTRSGDGHLRPGPARPVPGTGRARGKSEDHVTLQADSAPRSVGGSRRYSTGRMICAPQNQKKVTNREGGGGAAAPWRPGANAVRGAFSGFTGLPVEVAFAESRHGCRSGLSRSEPAAHKAGAAKRGDRELHRLGWMRVRNRRERGVIEGDFFPRGFVQQQRAQ